jgi:hypothetical protein
MQIVGGGRVGGALAARGVGELIDRERGWARLAGPGGEPVMVATRPDDLAAVVARVPARRRVDLVFVQNGAIRDHLDALGVGGATRGLLFFAVAARGQDLVPGGSSPFTGPHAAAVVAAFGRAGVPAEAVADGAFRDLELEKLLWNSIFGALGDELGLPVGAIAAEHRAAVAARVADLAPGARRALGATVDDATLIAKLCAYSASIPAWRAAAREDRWRMGWLRARAAS